jgi:small-conductance mechanosensitive channel
MTFEQKKELYQLSNASFFDIERLKLGFYFFLMVVLPVTVALILLNNIIGPIFPPLLKTAVVVVFCVFVAKDKARRDYGLFTNSNFWWGICWRLLLASLVQEAMVYFSIMFFPLLLSNLIVYFILLIAFMLITTVIIYGWIVSQAYWDSAKPVPDHKLEGYNPDYQYRYMGDDGPPIYDSRNIAQEFAEDI